MMEQLEKTILDATREAGMLIKEHAFDHGHVEWKKQDDPVTWLDREAESIIRDRIGSAFLVNFYGEEYGIQDEGHDITIYIDPIDGTKSFIRGEFHSSVSVAAERDGRIVFGTVYDFMRDIMYAANRGSAWLSTADSVLSLPLASTPHLHKYAISVNHEQYRPLLSDDRISLRQQAGSVALSMAQLAAGSYDGLVMKPYEKDGPTDIADIAAGYHIMRMSGIDIHDSFGQPYDHRSPKEGIIAVRPHAVEKVYSLLRLPNA